MVPVCDKRYHIYNRFRHFWAEIKKLWNYPLAISLSLQNIFFIRLFKTMNINFGDKRNINKMRYMLTKYDCVLDYIDSISKYTKQCIKTT